MEGLLAIMMIMVLGSAAVGLIPASVASGKGRSFGVWWLYGTAFFLIALIHALLADDLTRRPCPWCAESIRPEARICPHCSRETGDAFTAPALPTHEIDPEELRWALRLLADADGDIDQATRAGGDRDLTRMIGELAEHELIDLASWDRVTVTQLGADWLAADDPLPIVASAGTTQRPQLPMGPIGDARIHQAKNGCWMAEIGRDVATWDDEAFELERRDGTVDEAEFDGVTAIEIDHGLMDTWIRFERRSAADSLLAVDRSALPEAQQVVDVLQDHVAALDIPPGG